ncbi:hypothetical protein LCGC14_0896920 [marine sediment metagenome]|uniref:Uncharacterized protein n=1 Tax=marine sediment metagenome TaxID=412755 RepID=A0A0F9PID2_9ZZZZ
MASTMQEIKIFTRAEHLMVYYNANLKITMADRINLELFKTLKDDEVIANIPIEVPGREQPSIRQITVKDARKSTIDKHNKSIDLIHMIAKMLKDEGVEVAKEAKIDVVTAETKGVAKPKE